MVVDKLALQARFLLPGNPYEVALSQLLGSVCGPPGTAGPWRPDVTRILAESRGKREDKNLQAVYQWYRKTGLRSFGAPGVQARQSRTVVRLFPRRVDFPKKRTTIAGLELCDLAAYPLGRAMVSSRWDDRAYQIISGLLRSCVVFP